MITRVPTYLTQRNGVFYFQAKIPNNSVLQKRYKKILIRRSTGTGDRREALIIAREFYVKMMNGELTTDQQIERSAAIHGKKYTCGREVYERLSQVDSNDTELLDALMDEFNFEDTEALNYFQGYQPDSFFKGQSHAAIGFNTSTEDGCSETLSDLINAFLRKKDQSSEDKHIHRYTKLKNACRLFLQMVGDVPARDIIHDLIEDKFLYPLNRVPLGWCRLARYKRSDGTLMSMSEMHEVATVGGFEFISSRTRYNYAMDLKAFLKWCEGREMIKNNWFFVHLRLLR